MFGGNLPAMHDEENVRRDNESEQQADHQRKIPLIYIIGVVLLSLATAFSVLGCLLPHWHMRNFNYPLGIYELSLSELVRLSGSFYYAREAGYSLLSFLVIGIFGVIIALILEVLSLAFEKLRTPIVRIVTAACLLIAGTCLTVACAVFGGNFQGQSVSFILVVIGMLFTLEAMVFYIIRIFLVNSKTYIL